jgi:hypothetical protein
VLTLAVAVAVAAGAAQARPQASQGMYGIQIVDYKVNPDGTVTVDVKIRGFKMKPKQVGAEKNVAGAGHWHLYVNGKYNNYSANATSRKTTALKKGDYKVYVTLNNNDIPRSPSRPGRRPSP